MAPDEVPWEDPNAGVALGTGKTVVVRASQRVSHTIRSIHAGKALEGIVKALKKSFDGWDEARIRAKVADEYVQIGLRDPSGSWKAPALAEIDGFLLPSGLGLGFIHTHIDRIATAAVDNEYLNRFLGKIWEVRSPNLEAKVESEGPQVLTTAVCYSVCLERLTCAMRDNWRILKVCDEVWKKEMEDTGARSRLNVFGVVKYESVKMATDAFLSFHETGKIPAEFGKVLLPLNIVEACVADVAFGRWDNAQAGWVLARHGPDDETNPATDDSGPAHWSADKKAVLLGMPLPRKWADLYSVWNLAFVAGHDSAPFHMAKLLIPRVGAYKDCPDEYMYNRAIALYAHMHRLSLGKWDGIAPSGEVKWGDAAVATLWGQVNEECAREYEAELKKLDPSTLSRLGSHLRGMFKLQFDP